MLGGSGQGEQIAANKVPGVRAALCNDLFTARLSREHNDANVLSMGGRIVAFGLADEILDAVAEHRRSTADAISAGSIRSPRRKPPTEPTTSRRGARPVRPTQAEESRRITMATETTRLPIWRTLAETDPEIADADPERGAPAERRPRADRVGELRQPCRPRSGRIGPDEQVRGRLSGPALLRRLRVRGRRRARRDRPREGAVRRRARQRAAALGRAGEHVGLPAAAEAGRHGARHEPGARRAPDARPSAQLLRSALHDRPLRRAQGRRADRLRRARSARRRAQAEDDHRRRERVSADHRLRAHPRGGRPRRRRRVHRHGAHRRPRGWRRAPEPGAALRLRHDDDAQDAARAARRHGALPRASTRRSSTAACSPAFRAVR